MINTASEGGLTSTQSDVHTILQGALLTNAVAIILAHNHPSGNVKPSTEDINTTAKITKAAKLLDISVLDHISTHGRIATVSLMMGKSDHLHFYLIVKLTLIDYQSLK